MATLLENERTIQKSVTQEAELHNAGIKERYRRLRDAEERQFAQETQNASDYTVRASVLAPERPAFTSVDNVPAIEQTPQVTEYVRERIQSPVFTTDKFNAVQEEQVVQRAQTVQAPAVMPTVTTQAAVSQEASYSLSSFAKKAIVAFAATVTVMMSLICVNTHIINQKRAQLEGLQAQKQELIEQNAELQRRIEEATSEETIREYAISQGMISGN